MTDEKKLYTLMVQAEDLQEHAKLLNEQAEKTQKTIEKIEYKTKYVLENFSKNIDSVTSKTVKKSLIIASLTGVSFLFFGVITFFSLAYYTQFLRNEINNLNIEIDMLKSEANKIQSWGIKLIQFGNGTKGIQLPSNIKFDRIGEDNTGKTVIVLN